MHHAIPFNSSSAIPSMHCSTFQWCFLFITHTYIHTHRTDYVSPESHSKFTTPTNPCKISTFTHPSHNYTGNSEFRLPPANTSNARWTYGPITGIFPANWPMVIRKSPKRINRPYSSIRKPVSVQRKRIRKMPQRKAAVPWSFWRRVKKAIVFWRPIIRLRPMRKRIYFG